MSSLVLLIEDDDDVARLMAQGLKKNGHRVRRADMGRAGLKLTRRGLSPDIVLLDACLPDISGTEVCRQLRRSPTTSDVPIVFVSAMDTELDRVVAFEVGADDYVAKPFSLQELLLRVRAVLRRSDARLPSCPS